MASTHTWSARKARGSMRRPPTSPPVIGSPASALPADPSLLDTAEVLGSLGVGPASGLSSAEAAERLARAGRNRLDPAAQVPAWRKLLAQFADPLIYLLLAAIAIAVAALQRMAAPAATLLRDGQQVRVPAEELVPATCLSWARVTPSVPTAGWSRRRRCRRPSRR